MNASVNNGKTIHAIIDFDFIINTDIGVIRFIRDKYSTNKELNQEILNKRDRYLLSLLYTRENINPLSIIVKDGSPLNIDNLYKGLLNQWNESILKYSLVDESTLTFIRTLAELNAGSGVAYKVSVKSDIEERIISKLVEKINVKRISAQDILEADTLYFRDYSFLERYNVDPIKVKHKTLYTTSRLYNINYFNEHEELLKNNVVYSMENTRFMEKENE